MPRLMVVEWPDGLQPDGEPWQRIAQQIEEIAPDLLLTNEMPFGSWLPRSERYDAEAAEAWVQLHERGVAVLAALKVEAVMSSRPVPSGRSLANEAFTLVAGRYTARHHKQRFPEEPGWHESTWFQAALPGFAVHEVAGVHVGFLLCTELMFNEHARRLGRAGADLIAVPRATGLRRDSWETAAGMASLVGGCYVATSNRVGRQCAEGPIFGGHGFVVAPGGARLATTEGTAQMQVVELDLSLARKSKHEYPCYVPDTAHHAPAPAPV